MALLLSLTNQEMCVLEATVHVFCVWLVIRIAY